jgi:hypothetical protein
MVAAHHDTSKLGIHEVVRRLNRHLGATLVATLSGSKDPKAPYRWAREDGNTPSESASQRLRAAHRIWTVLADAEGEHTTRAWFVGLNPLLEEDSPVMALREGHIKEVISAADMFLADEWED